MAKSSNQKLKLLYLMRCLLEKTDEQHPMTIAQMIDELSRCGVSAERKSLYDDLEMLRVFGLVLCRQDRKQRATTLPRVNLSCRS